MWVAENRREKRCLCSWHYLSGPGEVPLCVFPAAYRFQAMPDLPHQILRLKVLVASGPWSYGCPSQVGCQWASRRCFQDVPASMPELWGEDLQKIDLGDPQTLWYPMKLVNEPCPPNLNIFESYIFFVKKCLKYLKWHIIIKQLCIACAIICIWNIYVYVHVYTFIYYIYI